MIFSVLLNEWGGGQQLEGVDAKDVLSSLEKGKDQMEPGFGNGQVEDTKEEMARQDLIIGNNDEKAPFSLEDTKAVNSKERGLQKEDAKEEMVRNEQDVLSRDSVGLWKKGTEKTKREVKGRKQVVKSDKPKPDAEEGGPERKKEQRNSKKEKGVKKAGQNKERKIRKKYLIKEKLQLKREVSKLKEQREAIKLEKLQLKRQVSKYKEQREKIKREIRRANQRRRKINGHGKENGANCRKASSRDVLCVEKMATFTSVALAQAPNIIKQVENIF